MTAAPPRAAGLWHAVARTWRVAVPAVVVAAAAQTALTLPGTTPSTSGGFLALLIGSFLVATATVWMVATAAVAAVRQGRVRWRWSALGGSAVAVALAAASAILFGPLAAVVAVGGALLVVALAAGIRPRPSRRMGWWVLQALAVVALVVPVEFGLGFFLDAVVAAFLANLVAGAAAAIVLVGAARVVDPPGP